MIYRRTPGFKKAYKVLPDHIKAKVRKAFVLFQQDPRHPSLGVKKVKGTQGIWEGRIDDFYRFTFQYLRQAEAEETICLFRNIGPHDIIETSP